MLQGVSRMEEEARGNSRDNHAGRRSGIGGVQETDAERPAIGPARAVLEMSKDVFGIVTTILGDGKDRDHHGDDPCKGPEDSGSLCSNQQNNCLYV